MAVLQGTNGSNTLSGGGSDDTIFGADGNDTLYGGNGHDWLYGSSGNDHMFGGAGNDRLFGSSGNDTLDGGTGNDTLDGSSGNDTIWGAADNDTIDGGSHDDKVWGGTGHDWIDGDSGDDTIWGDDGNDRIDGDSDEDTIWGGAGDDELEGDSGNDEIWGGTGHDWIDGGSNDDTIWGEDGNDWIDGDSNEDTIWGGAGDDELDGDSGDDTIWGGDHDDSIDGDCGDDTLYGDGGNDRLSGGGGNDAMYGEAGDDSLTGADSNDRIWGDDGEDVISGGGGRDRIYGGNDNDTIFGGACDGDDTLYGDAGDDRVFGLFSGDHKVFGGAGNDTLVGGHDEDTFYGDAGDDSLYSVRDDNTLFGGAGTDTAFYAEARHNYTITNLAGGFVRIVGGHDCDSVDDLLKDVEFARFADQQVMIGNTAPVAVADVNGADLVRESGVVAPGNTAFPGDPSASGNVLANDTDADPGQAHSVTAVNGSALNVGSPVGGTYGSVTIGSTGAWTYALDNLDPDTQALAHGQTVVDSFTYTNTDAGGLSSSTTLKITITGTNDAPDITMVAGDTATPTLAETNAALTSSGTLTVVDLDLTDSVTSSVHSVAISGTTTGAPTNAQALAMLSVGPPSTAANPGDANNLAWSFNSTPQAFDYLAVGQSLVLAYTVKVTDTNATTDTQTVKVTITGTNDGPNIFVGAGDSAAETLVETNAPLAVSGTLSVTDADLSNSVTPSVTSVALSGTTTGAPTNAQALAMLAVSPPSIPANPGDVNNLLWSFDSSPEAFDYLAVGESLVLTYTVEASDGTTGDTQTLKITVTGTNDGPDILVGAGDSAAKTLIETNAALAVSGSLTVVDADLSNSVTPSVTAVALSGTTAGGPTNAQALAMLSVAPPSIAADPGDANNLGWSFNSAPEAFNYLAAGQSLVLAYTVKASDGALSDTQTVTVTITGTNDGPDITVGAGDASAVGLVENNTPLAVTGALTVVDADLSDSVTPTVDSVALSGTTTGAPTNAQALAMLAVAPPSIPADPGDANNLLWSFDSTPEAFDYLAAGESLVLTYTVKASDGTLSDTQSVTITITGTNDGPDIAVGAGDSAAEILAETNAPLAASGSLTVTDADLSDSVTPTVNAVLLSGTTTGAPTNAQALTMLSVAPASIAGDPGGANNLLWSFNSTPEAFDYLAIGESLVLTYTVKASDGTDSDTQTVKVTVTGTNDGPDIFVGMGDSAAKTLIETNAALAVSGSLSVTDADLADSVTPTVDSVVLSGTTTGAPTNAQALAMLAVAPASIPANPGDANNLGWSFNSAPEAFDYLAAGEQLVLTYTVKASDGTASDTQTVKVTITGTNDGPDIFVGAGDSAAETLAETDVPLAVSGSLTVVDADLSNSVTPSVNSVALSGTIAGGPTNAQALAMLAVAPPSIGANSGDANNLGWSFNSAPEAFNYLAAGESLVLTYAVKATDGASASDTQTVAITITGTNDGPDITVGAGDSAAETLAETNAALSVSGSLSVTDGDLSGSVTPTVDAVVLSGTTTGAPANAQALAMLALAPPSIPANPGDVNNLLWSFNSAPEAFDYLAVGESLVLTYTVKASDGTASDTQAVAITITGTNDGPDIAVGAGDSAAETLAETNVALSVSGSLSVTDADLSDSVTPSVDSVALSGTTTGAPTNAQALAMLSVVPPSIPANPGDVNNLLWSFDSSPEAFDYLAVGESLVLTYTVKATDGTTGDTRSVTITITGANDGPDITVGAGDSAAETLVETNAPLKVSGSLSVTDGDLLDNVTPTVDFVVFSGTTTGAPANAQALGMLSVSPPSIGADPGDVNNLLWSFDSTPQAFDYLAAGQSLVLTYTVKASDGTASDSQSVAITITGTNDGPDIAVGAGDSAAETLAETNVALSVSGTLTVTDADLSDSVTPTVESVALSGTTTGAPTNAQVLAMLSVVPPSIAADPGDANNLLWSFDSTPEAFDYLAVGESLILTYTVKASDGALSDTQSVAIAITGANDGPDITVGAGDSAAESLIETNAPLKVSGSLSVADPDLLDNATPTVDSVVFSGTTTGAPTNAQALAMLAVAPPSIPANPGDANNLLWSFDSMAEAFDYLAVGQSLVLTYTVKASDGALSDTQTVAITISGTNDGPDIAVGAGDASAVTLGENDVPLAVSGSLSVTDADLSDSVMPTVDSVALSGTTTGAPTNAQALAMLSVGPPSTAANPGDANNLAWSFDSTPQAFDYLAAGQSLMLTYTVKASDGALSDTQTVTVTITGTNDGPDIIVGAGDSAAKTLAEANAPLSVSGSLSVTDADLSDNLTPSVDAVVLSGTTTGAPTNAQALAMLAVSPPSIAANPGDANNLAWSFNSAPEAFNYLATGESLVLTYTVKASDGALSDTQTVTITITGTNDGPDITVGAGDSAAETLAETNAALAASGSLSVTDADLADSVTPTVNAVLLSGTTAGAPTNAQALTMLSVAPGSIGADPGSVNNLLWSFNSTPHAFDYLAAGESLVLTYTVKASDGALSDTQTVAITITGTNDGPDITTGGGDSAAKTLVETNAALTTSGTLTVVDPDVSNTITPTIDSVVLSGTTAGGPTNLQALAMLGVSPGTIGADPGSINNLAWSFNSTPQTFNYLATGESLVLTYTVKASDGTLSDTQTVAITITGTSDGPDITVGAGDSAAKTLAETNAVLTTSGTLTVVDTDIPDNVTPTVDSVVLSGTTTGAPTNPQALAMLGVSPGSIGADPGSVNNLLWSFNSTPHAFDYLAAGESLVLTYTVKASDGTASDTQTVAITITGTNDGPDIFVGAGDSAAKTLAETNAALTTGGTLTVVDADLSDSVTPTVTTALSGTTTGGPTSAQALGMFTIPGASIGADPGSASNLAWSFNSNLYAFDYLAAGEQLVLTYTVKVTDGQAASDAQTVAITITGTNDGPDITVGAGDSAAKTLAESNAALTTSGTLTVVDPDVGNTITPTIDSVVLSGTTAGGPTTAQALAMLGVSPGSIGADPGSVNNLGWSFNSTPQTFNYLATGESLVLTYTVKASDGTLSDTQTVAITITGTSDGPDITVGAGDSAAKTLAETNAALTTGGTLTVVDTDIPDNVTPSVDSVVLSGTTTGAPTNVQALAMLGVSPGSIGADPGSVNNLLWSFDSTPQAFDYLAAGQSLVLTYTVKASDGTASDTQTVAITITGTNDGPDITTGAGDSAAKALAESNAALTTSGTLTVVDPDVSNTITPTVDSVVLSGTTAGGPTNLQALAMLGVSPGTIGADPGSVNNLAWSFNSTPQTFNYLATGESLVLTYTVKASDGTLSDTQTVAITITGTSDGPDITVGAGDSAAKTLAETNAVLTTSGTLTVVDTDIPDNVTPTVDSVVLSGTTTGAPTNPQALAMLGVSPGSIGADPGSVNNLLWSFNSTPHAFDYLAAGESLVLTYTVKASDGTASDTQTVAITITGTNDGPDIFVGAGDSAAKTLAETNAALTTGGTLTVVDADLSDSVTPSVDSVALSGTTTGAPTSAQALGMFTIPGASIGADPGSASNLAWSFNSNLYAFDYLAAGEQLVLTYTVKVTDGQAASDAQTVAITITGTNDGPDITVGAGDSAAKTLAESNAALTTSGTLTVVDPDVGNTITPTIDSVVLSGTTAGGPTTAQALAMLGVSPGSIGADPGSVNNLAWSFNSTPQTFNYLATGESLVLTYTVKASDGALSDTQTVTITITGTSDGPDITVGAGDSAAKTLAETNAALTTGGTLTVVDTDIPDNVTPSVDSVVLSGTTTGAPTNVQALAMLGVSPGSIGADPGSVNNLLWSFDSTPHAFDYLAAGQSLVLTYTVKASDGTASDTQTVAITITGTNDGPDITTGAGDSAAKALAESNAALTTSGTLTVVDADLGNSVTPTVDSVVLSGTTAGGPTNLQALAMLGVSPGSIGADPGSVNNLLWSFNSTPHAFDYLAAGESLVLTYTVKASDGTASDTQTVAITITGTNDGPDIFVGAGDSAAKTLAETNAALTTGGTLTVVDADLSDSVTPTVTTALSGTTTGGPTSAQALGMFTIPGASIGADPGSASNLAWSFNSNLYAFDYLAAGEQLVLTYTVKVTDGQAASDAQTVAITITGTNDGPDITVGAGDSAAKTLAESNAALTTSGTLTVVDPDVGNTITPTIDSVVLSGTTAGGPTTAQALAMLGVSPGSIGADPGSVNNLGWSFNSTPQTFNYLATGESLVLTYTVKASDGTLSDTQTVAITITGTSDGPDITVGAGDSAAKTLAETNAALTTGGTLTVVDTDIPDNVTPSVDSVVLSGTTTGAPTNVQALAMLGVSPGSIGADPGSVNNLLWSFDSTPQAFDYLAAGQSLVLTYTVKASDGTASDTQTVAITITGTNDGPDITTGAGDSAAKALAESNAALTTSGTLTVVDPDVSNTITPTIDSVVLSGTTAGGPTNLQALAMLGVSPGTIGADPGSINNLAWSFNSTPQTFNYLATGESLVLTYTVKASDGTLSDTQTVAITITGTSDGPDITVGAGDSAAKTLAETNAVLTTSGTLTVVDTDIPDNVTPTVDSVVLSGTTTGAPTNPQALAMLGVSPGSIGADPGSVNNLLWSFNSTPHAFDYLAAGESLVLTYTVKASDGTASDTQTVAITITGTNDGPDIFVGAGDSAAKTLAETNAALTTGGTLTVVDADLSDSVTPTVTTALSGTTTGGPTSAQALGMFTIPGASIGADPGSASNLAWSFNSNLYAFDYLAAGEQLVLTYTVKVTDGQAASDAQTVAITITGTNDGPDITVGAGDSAAKTLAESNAALTTSGTLTVVDPDVGNTITPTIDSVVLSGTTAGGPTNLQALAMLGVSPGSIGADPGSVNNLAWSFNSTPQTFNYLATGESLVLTYTVKASDGALSDTQTVTITITGTSDGPDITVGAGDSAAKTLAETNAALTTGGTLTVVDTDIPDNVTPSVDSVVLSGTTTGAPTNVQALAMLGVSPGSIGADPGSVNNLLWSFDSTPHAFDYLAAGQSLVLTYTVKATDGTSSDTETVTITITGTNDGPDITTGAGDSAAKALAESNAALTTSGTLTVVDPDVGNSVTPTVDSVVLSGTTAGGPTNLQALAMLGVSPGSIGADPGSVNNLAWSFNSTPQTFDYLATGESLVLTYTVRASDGVLSDTQTVAITITGTNDAPAVTGTVNATTSDVAAAFTLDGTSNAIDFDAGAALDVTNVQAILPDGVTRSGDIFTLDPAAYLEIALGDSTVVTANYDVTDGSASTPDQIRWTITGTEAGDDTATGTAGANNTWFGGVGDDHLAGANLADWLFGGLDDDTLEGLAGIDSIDGGAGDDTLFGGLDNDIIDGNIGADTLYGGGGNDRLFGAGDNDRVFGGAGNSTLDGGTGNDLVEGGSGGNDTVSGGAGNDTLYGGSGGIDTLSYAYASGGVSIDAVGGSASVNGGDIDTFSDFEVYLGTSGNDIIHGDGGTVYGGGGSDFIDPILAFGGTGDDIIVGELGENNTFYGGDDNDRLIGRDGIDTMYGGGGTDTASFGGDAADFAITNVGGNVTVVGLTGTTYLQEVEKINFVDGFYDVAGVAFHANTPLQRLSDTTLDQAAQDPSQPGDYLYAGTGIQASDFAVVRDHNRDLELGLQVIYRNGPSVPTSSVDLDGTVHFDVPTGFQTTVHGSSSNDPAYAAWSFEYSINAALNGNTSQDLSDYEFHLLFDTDPSGLVNYADFMFVASAGAPGGDPGNWVLVSGLSPASVGSTVIANDEGTAQVTQNSLNYASFAPYVGGGTYVSAGYGTAAFDLVLQAMDPYTDALLFEQHIVVHVAGVGGGGGGPGA